MNWLGYSVGYSAGSAPGPSGPNGASCLLTRVELLGYYSKWTYWKERTDRIFRYTIRKSSNPAILLQNHHRKLSAAQIGQLVEQYQAGATVYELATAFKIHRVTASQHLQRSGVVMRRQGLSDADTVTAADLYAEGWSLARIGERFGVAHTTVRRALLVVGVRMREPWERA